MSNTNTNTRSHWPRCGDPGCYSCNWIGYCCNSIEADRETYVQIKAIDWLAENTEDE